MEKRKRDAGIVRKVFCTVLASVLFMTAFHPQKAYASSTSRTPSEYWYNGSVNGQPDNTFTYRDGSTHGKVFTSKPRDPRIEATESFGRGVSEIRFRTNKSSILNKTSLRTDEIEYFASQTSTIEENARARGAGGAAIMSDAQALGLTGSDLWRDYYARAFDFSGYREMQKAITEAFYTRNLWHLRTDGVTSWCLDPYSLIGSTAAVDGSTILGTRQWEYVVSLIAGAAQSLGADTNEGIYQAAQCLIWEVKGGVVDYHTLRHTGNMGLYNGMITGNGLSDRYEKIKREVAKARTMPSFLSNPLEYRKRGGAKTYFYPASWNTDYFELADRLVLTDHNGLVDKWQWTDRGGYHFEVLDSSHLKVTAESYSNGLGDTAFEKITDKGYSRAATFTDGSGQAQVSLQTGYDPFVGYMDIRMDKGTAVTLKRDAEDGFPLSGDVHGTIVTIEGPGYDGTEEYDSNSLPLLSAPGRYTVRELHAPRYSDPYIGYVNSKGEGTVDIGTETASGWYAYSASDIKDTRQKLVIEVQKKDSERTRELLTEEGIRDAYSDYEVTTDLSGIFDVYAYRDIRLADGSIKWSKDQLVTTIYTDKEGFGASERIDLGVYYVKERKAPFGYYNPDGTHDGPGFNEYCQIVDEAYRGEDIECFSVHLDFENRRQKMKIQIDKKDAQTPSINTGLETVFEIWTREDIKTPDGSVILIPKDTLVETLYSDDTGYACSSELDAGLYRVKEIDSPSGNIGEEREHGYLVNTCDTIYSGAVHTDEQDIDVFITGEDGSANSSRAYPIDSDRALFVALRDKRQKGVILIQKSDNMRTYLNHGPMYEEYIDCTLCHGNFLKCTHTVDEYLDALESYHQHDGRALRRLVRDPVNGQPWPNRALSKEEYIRAFRDAMPLDILDPFYDGHDMRLVSPIPQGDASFIGSVFDIYAEEDIVLRDGTVTYKKGDLVDTVTSQTKDTVKEYRQLEDKYGIIAPAYSLSTAEDGQYYSKELDIGRYRVVETGLGEGYQFRNWKSDSEGYVIDVRYTGDIEEQSHVIYKRYPNDVILGHLAIKKLLTHELDNRLFNDRRTSENPEYNPDLVTDIPVKDVYFAVYLQSRENGEKASKTRLPDEFFLASPLDRTARTRVIKDGEGEVVDGYHYGSYFWADHRGKPTDEPINPTLDVPFDPDRTNAALKSLYLILRTNDRGLRSTYDTASVVYVNLPLIGRADDIDIEEGKLPGEMGIIPYSVPLPYGSYRVVELTSPEGYQEDDGVVNGDEVADVEFFFEIGDERKTVDGNPYLTSERNVHSFTVKNREIRQRLCIYKVDNEMYVRENESQGGESLYELVPTNGAIKEENVLFRLWCWNSGHDSTMKNGEPGTGSGNWGETYRKEDIGNEELGYWYTYTAYDPETFEETVIDTFATDAEGCFELPSRLVYGDYSLIELNAPYGYWLPDPENTDVQDVIRDENGDTQRWIGYTGVGGQFIYTVDAFGNDYGEKDNITNFTVENSDTDIVVTLDIKNEAQKAYVVLEKTGLMFTGAEEVTNGEYVEKHPVFEQTGLEGAQYTLYAARDIITGGYLRYRRGEEVTSFVTDSRGIGVSEPVHLGKYILKETRAPFGFVLDENEYELELEYLGQEVRIYPVRQEKYDIRQEVEFRIQKEEETVDGSFIPSAGGVGFGLYAGEDLIDAYGRKAISTDELIETIEIRDGEGTSKLSLPTGSYYLKELWTNEGMRMDTHEYPVVFRYTASGNAYDCEDDYLNDRQVTGAGKGEAVIEIGPNGGVAIRNLRKRADIELFKSLEGAPAVTVRTEEGNVNTGMAQQVSNADTAHLLKGVSFTLFDSEGEALAELVTNSHGHAYYPGGLTVGSYFLVETDAGDNPFVDLDADEPLRIEFEVTSDMYNEILTFNVTNEEKDGLLLSKKDVATGELIPGCKVEIRNEDGERVCEGVTDSDGKVWFSLEPGRYTYREYRAPSGYLLDENEYPFEILEGGGIVRAVMTDRKTPSRERTPVYGRIRLSFKGKGVRFGGDLSRGYDEETEYGTGSSGRNRVPFAAVTALVILIVFGTVIVKTARKKGEKTDDRKKD